MEYIIILLSSFTHFLEQATLKRSNKKNSAGGFLLMGIVSFFSMIFFLAYYLFGDGSKSDFTPEVIPYAILAGIFYCTASFLTYIALGCGPFTITLLIISYSIVLISGYGILFFGEDASTITYIAFAIIILSLYLLRGKDKETGKKRISLKWLLSVIISVVTSALFSIIIREQQVRFNNTVTNECMIISLGLSAVILFAIGVIQSKRSTPRVLKDTALYGAIAGTANGLTNLLDNILNMMMAISISSPTKSIVKVTLSLLYSTFILKEKFLPRQIIGIIIGVAATIMINIA